MNYFFALPLGGFAKRINKDLLQPLQLVDEQGQLHWSLEENLHVTLAYLGPLTGSAVEGGARARAMQAARLRSAIEIAEQIKMPSFACDVESLGFFPDAKSRVLALHLKPDPALLSLQAKLLGGLQEAGFDCDDRPFKPHITLARLKHRQAIRDWQLPSYSATFSPQSFALYASEQAGKTAKAKLYQQITEFSLDARQSAAQ